MKVRRLRQFFMANIFSSIFIIFGILLHCLFVDLNALSLVVERGWQRRHITHMCRAHVMLKGFLNAKGVLP